MTYDLDDVGDISEALDRVSEFAVRVASREAGVLAAVRKAMEDRGLTRKFDPVSETDKNVEAVDSAHAVYRTLSIQLVATAAVGYSKRNARKVVNAIPSLLSDDAEVIARGCPRTLRAGAGVLIRRRRRHTGRVFPDIHSRADYVLPEATQQGGSSRKGGSRICGFGL